MKSLFRYKIYYIYTNNTAIFFDSSTRRDTRQLYNSKQQKGQRAFYTRVPATRLRNLGKQPHTLSSKRKRRAELKGGEGGEANAL